MRDVGRKFGNKMYRVVEFSYVLYYINTDNVVIKINDFFQFQYEYRHC